MQKVDRIMNNPLCYKSDEENNRKHSRIYAIENTLNLPQSLVVDCASAGYRSGTVDEKKEVADMLNYATTIEGRSLMVDIANTIERPHRNPFGIFAVNYDYVFFGTIFGSNYEICLNLYRIIYYDRRPLKRIWVEAPLPTNPKLYGSVGYIAGWLNANGHTVNYASPNRLSKWNKIVDGSRKGLKLFEEFLRLMNVDTDTNRIDIDDHMVDAFVHYVEYELGGKLPPKQRKRKQQPNPVGYLSTVTPSRVSLVCSYYFNLGKEESKQIEKEVADGNYTNFVRHLKSWFENQTEEQNR